MAAFFVFMARTIIGKYITVALAVTVFVAANFQHSPANTAYFSLLMTQPEGPGWGRRCCGTSSRRAWDHDRRNGVRCLAVLVGVFRNVVEPRPGFVRGKIPAGFGVPTAMLPAARAVLIPLGFVLALVVMFGFVLRQPRVADAPGEEPRAPVDIYDPVAEGEPTPPGFRQLLGRDGIPPIYEPVHVEAGEVDWNDDTLVIGVAVDGQARAYPVQALSYREMVNDHLGETPILASW